MYIDDEWYICVWQTMTTVYDMYSFCFHWKDIVCQACIPKILHKDRRYKVNKEWLFEEVRD